MSQLMDALSDPYFKPTKQLTIKDEVFISMLECCQNKGPCYVITDPSLRGDSLLFQLFDVSPVKWFSFLSYLFPDNPIIYASKGFTQYTGYAKEEVEGRNCRFLQGKDTCPLDISRIRKAIANKEEVSVCLLNYRKNGTTFLNQVNSSFGAVVVPFNCNETMSSNLLQLYYPMNSFSSRLCMEMMDKLLTT